MCRIVIFLGFPGAGKTTLMNYIKYDLYKSRVKITYLKTFFLITRIVEHFCKLFKIQQCIIHKQAVMLDLLFNIFYLSFTHLIRVFIPCLRNDYVMVEEHVFGSLVDYYHAMFVLNINKRFIFKITKILYRMLIQSNMIYIIINVPVSTVLKRQKLRGDPRLEVPTYLFMQMIIFRTLLKYDRVIVIDGTKDIKDLAFIIKSILWTRLS